MRVGIIGSSSEILDDRHKSIATSISNYLAESGYDLTYCGATTGIFEAVKREFKNQGRDIKTVTTKDYFEQIDSNNRSNTIVCKDTFEMKQKIFENSDIIVALPGGIGTLSEILSFIEEDRNGARKVPIEIYDEAGVFLLFGNQLYESAIHKMMSSDAFEYFKISTNIDEFINHIYEYERKEGKYGK